MGKLKRLARRQKMDIPLLSDEGSEIIQAFGLLTGYPQGTFYYGVPHPAIVVLGTDGAVAHCFTARHYSQRPEIDDVLAVLRKDATS